MTRRGSARFLLSASGHRQHGASHVRSAALVPEPPRRTQLQSAADERLEQVWAVLSNPKRSIRNIQTVATEHGFDHRRVGHPQGSAQEPDELRASKR
jgi:hypothetical protein